MAWSSIIYFLFTFSFKELVIEYIGQESLYKIFEDLSKKNPSKFSYMVRFCYIPEIFKNFMLCMLDVSFKQFIVPTLAYYSVYLCFPILIGTHIKSLKKFYNKGFFRNEDVSLIVMVYLAFAIAGMVLIGVIMQHVISAYKGMNDELKKDLTITNKVKQGDIENGKNQQDDDIVSQAESSKIFKM